MPIGWCTIEELVQKQPAARKCVNTPCGGEKPSDRCSCPWASNESGVHRGGDLMIRQVFSGKTGPILLGGMARPAEDCVRCRTPAGHGLGDPLPLHRVDQTGCITDQKTVPFAGVVPTIPILSQPPSGAAAPMERRRRGDQGRAGARELRQCPDCAGAGLSSDRVPIPSPMLATP